MPVGSYESRILYQRHTLNSNGKKVFLFYDQAGLVQSTVNWRFTEEDYFRTTAVWQSISEFNEAFGGLFNLRSKKPIRTSTWAKSMLVTNTLHTKSPTSSYNFRWYTLKFIFFNPFLIALDLTTESVVYTTMCNHEVTAGLSLIDMSFK